MQSKREIRSRRIYFVGVCRGAENYEWLQEALHRLQRIALEDSNDGNREACVDLRVRTYVTGEFTVEQVAAIHHQTMDSIGSIKPTPSSSFNVVTEGTDPVTKLVSPTFYGRPQWFKLLSDVMADLKLDPIHASESMTEPNVGPIDGGPKVGVFFCGSSAAMSKSIAAACSKFKKIDYFEKSF